jgi:hypothetical protein
MQCDKIINLFWRILHRRKRMFEILIMSERFIFISYYPQLFFIKFDVQGKQIVEMYSLNSARIILSQFVCTAVHCKSFLRIPGFFGPNLFGTRKNLY